MKNLKIPNQLLLLFFTIILICSTCFSLVTLSRLRFFAENEVYSRLTTYLYLLDVDKNNPDVNRNPGFPDMNVGFYHQDKEGFLQSENVGSYCTEKDIEYIVDLIKAETANKPAPPNSILLEGKLINSLGKRVYYVCEVSFVEEHFTVIFTDDIFSNGIIKEVSSEVILLFFLILVLAIIVIYLWSSYFVSRIRKIQNHIISLPKSNYDIPYEDKAQDEIGELSRSIEAMRKEIGANEETKREMLQNISHDFKTPIAVIKSYAEAQIDGMDDGESARIIVSQAELLKKKVNRLLQYNSLEYLKKDKEFYPVDMKELILEVLVNYKYLTEINFELDLDDNITFTGYKENLYTVVDNIIDNAKRYAKTKIKIVLKPERLRIYNDGDHIDEQFLNSVFKPYEKGSKGEFGLGMSIVRKTVDFFGLDLKVKNEEVGVSFIITSTNQKQ